MDFDLKRINLRPGGEKRLLRGHRWVFSNEIAHTLADYQPGTWVEVWSNKGVCLGSGYLNPHSLIAVRLVCPPSVKPSAAFFRKALVAASERRQRYLSDPSCCRLVYGESDGLPGLIVDRYRHVLVYQITTLGMALLEDLIRELLLELFEPEVLVFRHDSSVRLLEGLPLARGVAFGSLEEPFWIELDGLHFLVDPLDGQKTGLYLDQRENRRVFTRWVKGKKVLDLFCYNGAWGIFAAAAGASRVVGVDQSSSAIRQARLNGQRNGVEANCEFQEEEAFYFLKNVPRGTFDVIVLDPPAFAKNKNALTQAKKGYTDLNRRAMLALPDRGMLVTCSCSYHVDDGLFQEILVLAAQASGRQVQLLEARSQALDHPVLMAMPETRYLKCYFLEIF